MPSKSHRKKHALKLWKSLWVLCCPTRGNSLNSKGKHSQKHPPRPHGDRFLLSCARKGSPPPNSWWMYVFVQLGAFNAQQLLCTSWVSRCREISFHPQLGQGQLVLSLLSLVPFLPSQAKLSSSDLCTQMLGSAGSSEHFPGSSPLCPRSWSLLSCPVHLIPQSPKTREEWVLVGSTQILLSLQNSPAQKLRENGKQERKQETKNKHGFPKPIPSKSRAWWGHGAVPTHLGQIIVCIVIHQLNVVLQTVKSMQPFSFEKGIWE